MEHDPNDPNHGTHHQWDCWNVRDYTHYRDDVPRFVSEFGWQGPATWATLTRAVPAEALHKESPAFLLHQKAEDGNGKLDRGLAPHLPIPADFEDWHWATQLNQARAVRYGVEHHRSWWPRTAGSVVWQLNDQWPVTSWAMVDGDERPKPLWFAMRDAFADRLLTVQPRDGQLVVAAVNDTDERWTGEATVRRTTLAGEVLAEGNLDVDVPPRQVGLLALPDAVRAVGDVTAEVLLVSPVGRPGDTPAGEIGALHTWAEDTEMAYEEAPFDASVTRVGSGYRVEVTAWSLVRDLALLVDKLDPDARVDAQVVSVAAGRTAVFSVRTPAELDPEELVGPRVLRTANALVAADRRAATQGR
jgi:beta-mannosidase